MNKPLKCYLEAVDICAPGLMNWQQACSIFHQKLPYVLTSADFPIAEILPPREKRRASATVHLSLHLAHTAQKASGIPASELHTVFASSDGDSDIFDYLGRELARPDPEISPTLFHQSLHNSAAGYFGIAEKSHAASLSISAGEFTFASGLLTAITESLATNSPTLLVAYNLPYPTPMDRHYPMLTWFGISLIVSPTPSAHTLASITLSLVDQQAATSLSANSLESLRLGNPIARCLPFLEVLAVSKKARVIVDYLAPYSLQVELQAL